MKRVLIVDDKPENRYLLRALLQGHGFTVDEARHGTEALALARANPPSLVISDLLMPVMDGYSLLNEWKADARLNGIPFVVYTATYTEPQDEQLALSLGADAFILKPTEPEPFIARVLAVLATSRTSPPAPAAPAGDDAALLRQHNETLIRKLEAKMLQLQHINQALTEDVRQRQRAETALREQKEFLDAIITNEPECVKVISPTGVLEQMNPAGLAMLEVANLTEAQQGTLLDYLPPDQPEYHATYITFLQQVCGGKSGTLIYPVIGRRGTRRWLESHATPLRDERRGITLMLSITRDITERLRLEEDLRQAQKLEALGRLAGGIAHDFNNQLTVIQGYGALLEKQLQSYLGDERSRTFVSHIMNAAGRSADLVRQLLTFSRKGHAEVKPVDLHALINETIAVLEHSISKKIRLVRDLRAADAHVMGDASLLQNALMNLALNARDAMPDGGELRFSTALVDLTAEMRARLGPDNVRASHTTCLRVTISDTGHGMSPEIQSRIFEPFFSTKGPGAGTGLGLASVHGTIQRHGGDISVRSEPGQGTTFQLLLPRMPSDQVIPAPNVVAAPVSAAANHHVLVIDDEALVAALVEDTLTAVGYRVTCETNPVNAVNLYRQHWRTIDLIIVDLNMPLMNGAEVFAALRTINPSAKILLASGFSDEAGIADLLRHCSGGLLAKPFRLDDLVRRVAQSLA